MHYSGATRALALFGIVGQAFVTSSERLWMDFWVLFNRFGCGFVVGAVVAFRLHLTGGPLFGFSPSRAALTK